MLILCFPGFTVLHRLIVFAPKNTLVLQSYFLCGHVIKRCSSFIWVLKFDAAFFSCLSKFFEQVFVRIIKEPVLKFTKVTTSLLQLNVSPLFLMRIEILIDFALVHLAYVARQDVLGQVSKTKEVTYSEAVIYSVLLSVREFIKHRAEIGYLIMVGHHTTLVSGYYRSI